MQIMALLLQWLNNVTNYTSHIEKSTNIKEFKKKTLKTHLYTQASRNELLLSYPYNIFLTVLLNVLIVKCQRGSLNWYSTEHYIRYILLLLLLLLLLYC